VGRRAISETRNRQAHSKLYLDVVHGKALAKLQECEASFLVDVKHGLGWGRRKIVTISGHHQ
jgi:hypothetical protein